MRSQLLSIPSDIVHPSPFGGVGKLPNPFSNPPPGIPLTYEQVREAISSSLRQEPIQMSELERRNQIRLGKRTRNSGVSGVVQSQGSNNNDPSNAELNRRLTAELMSMGNPFDRPGTSSVSNVPNPNQPVPFIPNQVSRIDNVPIQPISHSDDFIDQIIRNDNDPLVQAIFNHLQLPQEEEQVLSDIPESGIPIQMGERRQQIRHRNANDESPPPPSDNV